MNPPPQNKPPEHKPLRGRLTVRLIVAVPALFSVLIIGFGYTVLSIIFHYAAWGAAQSNQAVAWSQTEKWTIFAMIIFFIASIIAGLALAFSILGPLRSISQALERAARGSLDAPLHVGGGWEMNSIGENFNSMIHYLNRVFQERNRFLLDNVQTGTMVLDGRKRIAQIDAIGEDLFGISQNDIAGLSLAKAADLQGETWRAEFLYALDEALASNQIVQAAQSVITSDDPPRHFSYSCSVERDSAGKPLSYVLSFRDISRGEAMRRMLARTDQLAALGAFSMGLAHELRNPLGSIRGMAQLLEESQEENGSGANFAGRIVQEVDRLDRFVRELLEFGQQSSLPPSPIDLSQLAEESLKAARTGNEEATEKALLFDLQMMPTGPVLVQQEAILRALANVIVNAFQASPRQGKVRIATFQKGTRAICEIENDGAPIAAKDLEKIFEPFYTTKPTGTGLGLAIASQVVSQNGGTLTAQPRQSGAKFVFAFPILSGD